MSLARFEMKRCAVAGFLGTLKTVLGPFIISIKALSAEYGGEKHQLSHVFGLSSHGVDA
jgi:hypothetical protein